MVPPFPTPRHGDSALDLPSCNNPLQGKLRSGEYPFCGEFQTAVPIEAPGQGYHRAPRMGDARDQLIAELQEHALVIGEVTLTSGRKAQYYIDAKRAILRPDGFRALGELVAAEAERVGATAVGGMTMGADPVACAALAAGAPVKAFFVRKERKQHGLQRWIEGPQLEPGERCLIVEDVVTTGGSTLKAIERVREEGLEIVGVVSVLDRLAGGAEAIRAAANGAPYAPLTTIDDVYPERPDA
jgi:orotate phosphoribosyltransferase